MAQVYTMIFAAEPGSGGQGGDVGHCWVAVEYPKGKWTVRGFYPDEKGFAGGIFGAAGIVKDDHERFRLEAHRLRTRTQRGLSEAQVRAALTYMFGFGASYRGGKMVTGGKKPWYNDVRTDTRATHGWSVFAEQCAWFAVNTCKAAGFLPVPYNTARFPWTCHAGLGSAGQIDAKNLPRPFGPGPA